MKLFDEKYVRVKWNNDLKDELVLVADECTTLEQYVEEGVLTERTYVTKSDKPKPFHSTKGYNWVLCYYDPLYEIKAAFREGKTIQYASKYENVFKDFSIHTAGDDYVFNSDEYVYRLKEKYLTLMELIAAINNKEQIQYTKKDGITDWIDLEIKNNILSFETDKYYYRIKPDYEISKAVREVKNNTKDEQPSHEITDEEFEEMTNTWEVEADYTRYCLGCDYQSCNGAAEPCRSCTLDNLNYVPVGKGDGIIKSKEKESGPFENTAELITHYINHFGAKTLSFCEPLIWVKRMTNSLEKWEDDTRCLITAYDELCVYVEDIWIDMDELYSGYTFLDGSLCGKAQK